MTAAQLALSCVTVLVIIIALGAALMALACSKLGERLGLSAPEPPDDAGMGGSL